MLRMVLQADPSDGDAVEHLERLFAQTERWEDLVENYERKLSLVSDDDTRRQLYFALAAVLEREIDDPDRAIEAYRSILGFRPGDLEALRALDRLFIRTEAWHERLEVLQAQAEVVDEPEQALQLRYAMGRLYETELGSPVDAVSTYATVLSEDASHQETRDALLRMISRGEETAAAAALLEPIYRREERWGDVVDILATRIEAADLPDERRSLYVDMARLQEAELADEASALVSWTAAARESADRATIDEIERLSTSVGAQAEIVPLLLELWDDAVDPALRIDLGLRVARIRESVLGDVDGAIEAYVRVHEEDPSETRALSALDRLYESTGRAEALADVLQKRTYVAADAREARTLRLRLARVLHAEMGDAAEAVSVYREVLADDPTNDEALVSLERMVHDGLEVYDISTTLDPVYREQGWWDRLVALNEARTRAEDSADERYRLWLDTADIRERQLADPSGTLVAVGRALQERPSDEALKERLESLAAATGEWERAASLYRGLLGGDLDETERFDTALRLAVITDDRLGDAEGAEAAYLEALGVEPGAVRALEALDRMYVAQGRWADLSIILGRLREVVYDQPALVSLTFRHAELKRDRLDDHEGAIAAFNDVLEVDPTHARSLAALVELYTAAGSWEELYETYERQSQLATDDATRVAILERMAAVAADQLGRAEDAIDLWRQVLAIRPDDPTALEHLAWLFGETEQYAELADVLDRQIAQAASPEQKVELLRSAGALWADALDNPDMAIQRYRAVHELLPDDAPTFAALRTLYELVGDHTNLVDVLVQMLELGLVAEEDRASVYQQLGELYGDVLGQPERAIWAWRARVELVPSDLDALDRLDALYTQEAQWGPCVDIIEARLTFATDDGDRIDLLKRIGMMRLEQLGDREGAAGAYERILDLDLSDFDAQASLERLYAELGSWDAMVGLYLDRLQVTEDPWERLQSLRQAASVYEERLSQPDGAFLIMAKAADEAPLDEEVLGELERLAALSGKQDELANLYTSLIARVAEDPEQGETATLPLLLAVGKLQDQGLGRAMLAEPYYDRALGLDPENETALVALESIYERTEEWDSLVTVLKRRATLTFDTTEQVAFYRRVGQLYETRLGDLNEATEAYRMVVRLDDTDADALSALERIYEAAGQWRELVEVLSRRAESTYEPEPLVELKFRIGRLWREQLNNPERAIEAFKDVLGVKHDHRDAMLQLEALYASLDKWDKYLDVVDGRLAIATDVDEQKEIYFAQAQVQERCFDDIDAAVSALNSVLMLDPKDLGAIEELERLYVEQERWVDLVDQKLADMRGVDEGQRKYLLGGANGPRYR